MQTAKTATLYLTKASDAAPVGKFCKARSGDELWRHAMFSNRMDPRRRLLTLIPLAVGVLFISPLLCLELAINHMMPEPFGLRLLNATERSRQPVRYGAMLLVAGSNVA